MSSNSTKLKNQYLKWQQLVVLYWILILMMTLSLSLLLNTAVQFLNITILPCQIIYYYSTSNHQF